MAFSRGERFIPLVKPLRDLSCWPEEISILYGRKCCPWGEAVSAFHPETRANSDTALISEKHANIPFVGPFRRIRN
jgi:hypothetical protein